MLAGVTVAQLGEAMSEPWPRAGLVPHDEAAIVRPCRTPLNSAVSMVAKQGLFLLCLLYQIRCRGVNSYKCCHLQ